MARKRRIQVELVRHPLVDTNILFDYLLYRYSARMGVQCQLLFLGNPIHQKSVTWYFKAAKPIKSTSHVIQEIHRHACINHIDLRDFWTTAREELIELDFDEQFRELLQMDVSGLNEFGPADAGLMQSAGPDKYLFTEDRNLALECARKSIPLIRLYQAQAWWEQCHESD